MEAGDQRHHHYGLAVDCGSATIVMQLLDRTRGTVVGEEKVVNGQVTYGTDLLTRILIAFLTGACLKTENMPNGEGFSVMQANLTQEYRMNFKEKTLCLGMLTVFG